MQNTSCISVTGTLLYYPFGMPEPARQYVATHPYRMGFNGQEKDDEVYGLGDLNTAEYWEYDTRLGRRWNIDPKYKNDYSNYATFSDNPIFRSDPNGDTDGGPNGPAKKGDVVATGSDGSPIKASCDAPVVTASRISKSSAAPAIQSSNSNKSSNAAATILVLTGEGAAVTSEVPPVALIVGVAGLTAAAAVHLYENAGNGNESFPGPWSYTHQPPSQNPINNPPQGFEGGKEPGDGFRGNPKLLVGGGVAVLLGVGAVKEWKEFKEDAKKDLQNLKPQTQPLKPEIKQQTLTDKEIKQIQEWVNHQK